jgi:excisionase family DNA binding protein
MNSLPAPPFTVETLAERWGCSTGAIRNRIRAGEIHCFRIGTLIRIPANEVEKIECPNMLSNGSEAGTPSYGTMRQAPAAGRGFTRAIGLERRPKPASHGG